ncbi:hypothetical protein [Rhizobium bangladeshense]|nr:hypothetical protein [Rhizobium bangladeshense]
MKTNFSRIGAAAFLLHPINDYAVDLPAGAKRLRWTSSKLLLTAGL